MSVKVIVSAGLFLVLVSRAIAGPIVDRNGVVFDEVSGSPIHYINPESLKVLGDRQISFDSKICEVVREQVEIGVKRFHAKRGTAMVMDVNTGEILGMSTYESFVAHPANKSGAQFNLATQVTYEFGSSAKAITMASGLEAGVVKPDTLLDARKPLRFGKYYIDDFRPTRKKLTPTEVMLHASNIGITRVQMALGSKGTKMAFFKAGQFSQLDVEGLEVAEPMVQKYWNELTAATVAYGHGYQIPPIQAAAIMASFANGGFLVRPTIFKKDQKPADAQRLWSQATADFMLAAMRRNVLEGTSSQINFPDVSIAGLTSTSSALVDGKYIDKEVMTSFAGVFPADKPKYIVLTFLDRPKALKETHGYQTSGWNAVPIAGEIIKRIAGKELVSER